MSTEIGTPIPLTMEKGPRVRTGPTRFVISTDSALSPDREYAYRNGQAVVTADKPATQCESATLQWIVTDHLGSPRMIVDQSGALSGVKRRDFMPYGEELGAGISGRTTNQGYVAANLRQNFTTYERDPEVNLDFAEARYYSPTMGRFTSPDPLMASATIASPQSWNRYAYTANDPVNYVDPSGLLMAPFISSVCVNGDCRGFLRWAYIAGFGEGPPDVGLGDGAGSGEAGPLGQQPRLSDSNENCKIQVRVSGQLSSGTPPFATGPDKTDLGQYIGTIDMDQNQYTAFEFRFEVTGSVRSGTIGRIGTGDRSIGLKQGGAWTIGQSIYVFSGSNRNGVDAPGIGQTNDDSPRYPEGDYQNAAVNGGAFAWHDGPGFLDSATDPLKYGSLTANFTVYVTDGKNKCQVTFSLTAQYSNGRWLAQIGAPK